MEMAAAWPVSRRPMVWDGEGEGEEGKGAHHGLDSSGSGGGRRPTVG